MLRRLIEVVQRAVAPTRHLRKESTGPEADPPRSADDAISLGHLDLPLEGARLVPGTIDVTGWARTPPVARIRIRVDGQDAGVAQMMATPRPDVVDIHPFPGAVLSGFRHRVSLARGAVPVCIEAVGDDFDGRTHVLGQTHVIASGSEDRDPLDASRLSKLVERNQVPRIVIIGSPPLRLVVFAHQLALGGAELYLFDLLAQLLSVPDVRCTVVSAAAGPLVDELERIGAVVHVTDFPMLSAEMYEARVLELSYLTRAMDANIVLVNTLAAGLGADLANRLQIPLVWAIHESVLPSEFLRTGYQNQVPRYIEDRIAGSLGTASALVFVADATRQVFEQLNGPGHSVTLHYGIPLQEINEYGRKVDRNMERERLGIDAQATVLLCIATFTPRKAQGALVMAFAQIASEYPDAVLVLVGDSTSPYSEAVHDVVDALGLRDRVLIRPTQRTTYEWYAIADAFVLASDLESLPRSILEAMAFGLTVLASDAFGMAELIQHGRNGYLFAPRDLRTIVQALRRFLSLSTEDARAIAEEGRRTVRSRHDPDRFAANYRALLEGLASDPTSRPSDLVDEATARQRRG
jgi:glycosyltransferase involved in cell wall biosynthesis